MILRFTKLLILLAFIGCKSGSDENDEAKIVDTLPANYQVQEKDRPKVQTPQPKTLQQDTIRNYQKTQMSDDFVQKASIDLRDSSLTIYENIKADYRIFGYQKPDTNSRKMIFFSVFTTDVDGNPYKCPYGSYYGSSSLPNSFLKYSSDYGEFVKANIIKRTNEKVSSIYILKKLVEFKTAD